MLLDIAEEAAQLEASERLPEGVDLDTLRKYFTLTTEDLEEVEQCRGAINKLGFGVQLCILRWQGYFLRDTRGVPEIALEIVASQLGLLAIPIDDYPQNEKTRWEHLERIRQHLGFSRCDGTQRQRLLDHLVEMAQGLPRSTALRQEAWRWLQTQKIVRPGRTTLRDIITAAREAALQQVYSLLFDQLAPGQREQIDALLVVPETAACTEIDSPSRSRLEQYKTLPRKESPEAVLAVLERLVAIGDLGLAILPVLAEVHPATRRLLANWGYHYEVWSLRRFAPPKRYAIVLCFLQSALGETTDAIVEMQDKLITAIHNKARERREDRLLATDEARRRAVEVLEELGTLVLDTSIPDEKLRERIFAQLPSADRRWTDFENYLIPRIIWDVEHKRHYASLGLPLDVEVYLAELKDHLAAVTTEVDSHMPGNAAVTINAEKGEFHLVALKGVDRPDEVETAKDLIQSRLAHIDLVDVLIDMDNETDFLRHFLHCGGPSRLPVAERRRNILAALIAIGCNLGPQRMAVASGLSVREISEVADWYLTEDALKAASIDLVNYASNLPLSPIYGRGASCSADGMRFYVPLNLLAADYSHVLRDRGITLYAHTADNCLRMHQHPFRADCARRLS